MVWNIHYEIRNPIRVKSALEVTYTQVLSALEVTYTQVWYIIGIVSSSPTNFHSERINLRVISYLPISIMVMSALEVTYTQVLSVLEVTYTQV